MNNFETIINECRASIEKADLVFLLPILYSVGPKRILEIGMHQGYSMELWRKAFNPEVLVGVELNAPTEKSYQSEPGMIWNQDSHEKFPFPLIKYDFLFIDGDHSAAGVKQDFEDYVPYVRSGGVVVLHDVFYTSADEANPVMVRPLWEGLKEKYPFIEIKRGVKSTGIGVLFV